jgi:hypothetical protein
LIAVQLAQRDGALIGVADALERFVFDSQSHQRHDLARPVRITQGFAAEDLSQR